MKRAVEVLLDVLAAHGITHIFGNPGTTELPLNDALVEDGRFRYTLALHEIPAMAMADGYSMASGRPAVVNLHIGCGLGNAMGMLYNAWVEGTPLIVTAGQQDRRFALRDPVLEADLVRVASPWTKWAYQVERAQDVALAVRRAIQTALLPPQGPVFLSLPLDLQEELVHAGPIQPIRLPDPGVAPAAEPLQQAAELLQAARNPAILAGSRVVETGAVTALGELAMLVGAPVFSEPATSHGRLPLPSRHPMYAGPLPLWSPEIHERLQPFDVILAVGITLLRQYIYREPLDPFPPTCRLIHLHDDCRQPGRTHEVEVALWGHPGRGLERLLQRLRAMESPSWVQRREAVARRLEQERQALRERARGAPGQMPLHADRLMHAIGEALVPQTVVVEEAVTTTRFLLERMGYVDRADGYFGHRGWALGWGLGCALGVRLAWPDRPVLALIGDGSAMYGFQALWNAARENLPLVIVLCNNGQYQILKDCAAVMGLPRATEEKFLGMDLSPPAIDFVGLARSLGVPAQRVESVEQLQDQVHDALHQRQLVLLDVPVAARAARQVTA